MEEKTEKKFSLTDIQMLNRAMIEHAAMATDVGEVKSFPLELAMIASVLHEEKMPQETINMVLAVRCGLPMQDVDLKSPYFAWVEGDAVQASEQDSASETLSRQKSFFRHRNATLASIKDMGLAEGLDVLASAMGELAAPQGLAVTVTHRRLVSV